MGVISIRSLLGKFSPQKEDDFLSFARLYRERLDAWADEELPAAERGHVAVAVMPWRTTPVPFFSIELARVFRQAGWRVTAIFDGIDTVGNASFEPHLQAVRAILKKTRSWLPVVEMRSGQAQAEDFAAAKPMAQLNAICRMRGEGRAWEFHESRPEATELLAGHLRGVRKTLEAMKPDRVIVPGGVYGSSGAYLLAAKQLGIGSSTFDSGPGSLRLSRNGVAAHLADLPEAFTRLQKELKSQPQTLDRISSIAEEELSDRMHCRDFRQFQTVSSTGHLEKNYDILVPLNIGCDTAALGRELAFQSITDWLRAVLEWVSQRSEISICIRQHPRERLAFIRGSDDWGNFIEPYRQALGERLRFVSAAEEQSTYDLLNGAKVVLPHTSTFGIEAALAGKPVIVGTNCYYADFGFVWRAQNKEDYFSLLDQALAGNLTVNKEARTQAALAYFLTQRGAFIRADFTPQPDDFKKWCQVPFAKIWTTPELEDYRQALLADEPLALVRAHRLLA